MCLRTISPCTSEYARPGFDGTTFRRLNALFFEPKAAVFFGPIQFAKRTANGRLRFTRSPRLESFSLTNVCKTGAARLGNYYVKPRYKRRVNTSGGGGCAFISENV